ncbi:MAG: DUF5668 domain-containing protein [Vicinamibacterales bacterium]
MTPFPDDNPGVTAHATDAARRATRAAHRAQMRAHFHARHRDAPVFFGVVLIGMGVLFLLDNLNLIEARYFFRNFWPLIVILFGLSRLVFGQGGERIFGAIATGFGSFWLADRLFDWDINVIGLFWPIILIGVGLNVLFKARWRADLSSHGSPAPPIPPFPGGPPDQAQAPHLGFNQAADSTPTSATETTDQSASLREVAILAGIERRNVSQAFRGGTITAAMGSVELDLRDCRMADVGASIWVQVIMGQVVLRLPQNWTVESRVTTVLGNLEDRSDRPVEGSSRRLVIDGSVFMGQVEIRN